MKDQFTKEEIAIVITKDGEVYANYPDLDFIHFDALFKCIEGYLTQASAHNVIKYVIPDMMHGNTISKLLDAKRKELGKSLGIDEDEE